MGLLARLLGGASRRRSEPEIGRLVELRVLDAVGVLGLGSRPDGAGLAYNHQPNRSGALTGTVLVADEAGFAAALSAARAALLDVIGGRAENTTLYLSARTPDGAELAPGALGLSEPPSGREVGERLG